MDEQDDKPELQVVDGIAQGSGRNKDQDWNPDNFPTSAKPIFQAAGLIVFLVVALSFAASTCSDTPESSVENPKTQRENPLDDSE